MAFGNCAGPARRVIGSLGGGFQYFLFSPLLGDMIQFDYNFQVGWNHQLVHIDMVFSDFVWSKFISMKCRA